MRVPLPFASAFAVACDFALPLPWPQLAVAFALASAGGVSTGGVRFSPGGVLATYFVKNGP